MVKISAFTNNAPNEERNILKIRVTNLILNSTCHGLPNILRSELKIIKLMWLILFVASTSVCVWFLVLYMIRYCQYNYTTQIELISQIPMQFPTITFKNLFPSNDSLDDILISCYFNDINCTTSNFEVKDNVFKFNSGYNLIGHKIPNEYSLNPGKDKGLQLELFAKIHVETSLEEERYYRSSGFHISIENYTVDPKDYDGIDVPTGFATNIAIHKVVSSKLDYPYSDCVKDLSLFKSDLIEFIKKSKRYNYRQKDCLDLCLSEKLIKECKYLNDSIELNYIDKLYENHINNNDLISCFDENWNKIFINYNNENCNNKCPLECDSIYYDTQVSLSRFPNLNYAYKLMDEPKIKSKFSNDNNITYEDLTNSLVAVNIFFNDLKYTSLIQFPQTDEFELAGDLGGILGLFIGVSFLSIGEIFEIIFEAILIFIQNRK